MAVSQPFSVPLGGGLNKSTNSLALLKTPGMATKLRNFEPAIEGGYRRINGYSQLGDGTRPNSSNDILGLQVYADGLIACSGTNIYFSQDGNSWLQINMASVATGGDNYSTFTGRSAAARTSQSTAHFAIYRGNSVYGEVVITDEGSGVKPFLFKMTGTGSALSSRTYFAEVITVSGTHYPKFCIIHDHHLVVAGAATALNTIYYSGTDDINDFTSTGSGSIVLDDQVIGLKNFRGELFIFCKNSIYKLQNINDSSTIAITPVTKNVGCVDGNTIQEMAGDLIFLAPDGFRTIAGTARIGDIELGTISKAIQPIVNNVVAKSNTYNFSSVVIRSKSQYRMYYSTSAGVVGNSYGIIGTLRQNGFEWSETVGIIAPSVASGFNYAGLEKFYHGDRDGYVYNHDTGDSYNPAGTETNIVAEYQSPDFDYGDLGTLKTLDHIKISITPEGTVEPFLRVRFDYGSIDITQPSDMTLDTIPSPAILGTALFNTHKFGSGEQPLVRLSLIGSGYSNFFKIYSDDTKPPYIINGLYINYRPSGRL